MFDRLFEVLLVQLLRQLMENGSTQVGLLAGFAHQQLRRAIVAMHQGPERDWSVESLAPWRACRAVCLPISFAKRLAKHRRATCSAGEWGWCKSG